MPKNTKVALGIVIAVVIIGLGWWMFNQNLPYNQSNQTAQSEGADTTISPNNNSNADISGDLSKVDTQMTGLDQDSAAVNQSNP
jgi:hypothetical protein